MANTITQYFDIQCYQDNTSSTPDAYTYNPAYQVRLDTSDFDGTVSYYLEVDMQCSSGTIYARLHNVTDGTAVSGSEISTSSSTMVRVRSGALSLSGDKVYALDIKNNSLQFPYYSYAAIVVVQSGTVTKTQVQVELGNLLSESSTTVNHLTNRAARFLYEASKWGGTVTIRHDAVVYGPSGNTTYVGLYDETAGAAVTDAALSQTGGSRTLLSSSPFTLTDGHTYVPTSYITGGSAPTLSNRKIVFSITNATKFLSMWPVNFIDVYTTLTTYDADVPNPIVRLISPDDFSVSSVGRYFEANMYSSNTSGISTSSLYDTGGTSVIPNTEVSVTGTAQNRSRSTTPFTLSGDKTVCWAIKSNNASYNAHMVRAYIVNEVTLSTAQTSPSVTLDTPTDTASVSDTTPELKFTGTDADSDDVTYQVQVDTDSGFATTATYYFDGHSGISDPDSAWVDEEDAFDGDESGGTSMVSNKQGDTSSNYLEGLGTTAPSSGSDIVSVRARVKGSSIMAPSLHASIATDSTHTEILGEAIVVGEWSWGDYVTLDPPSGGWTWSGLQELGVRIYETSSDIAGVGKIEIEVTTAPPIDALSDTDTGFANLDTPADTDPFTSGEQVGYTVQSALTEDTTYYWRVRSKDPSGTNEWGDWTTAQSFTISADGSGPQAKVSGSFTQAVTKVKVDGAWVSVTRKHKIGGEWVEVG